MKAIFRTTLAAVALVVCVAGIVTKLRSVNVFAEGAYMWRNFDSVDWDTNDIRNLPRKINLSGPSLRLGVQFQFKQPEETKSEGK
ncbi:MAG: hypothetical protein ABJB49_09835 [Nitrospirota bacterium]